MQLDAIVIDPQHDAEAAVIMLHGLGADGHDFESLPDEMELPERPAVRWILPHAPVRTVTANGGARMRAWFDVLGFDFETRDEDEPGTRAAAEAVGAIIDEQAAAGIPAGRIVLAGFSQGGALSLFTGLRRREPLAGVAALSCWMPLARSFGADAGPASARTPVFMGHGTQDPLVPVSAGARSRDLLRAAGVTVDWHEYAMPHSVCLEEIDDLRAWLQRVLSTPTRPSAR